ncbi:hypothetical protein CHINAEXTREME_03695 [Halobiforma lacisalsi AJ5]|uniref:Uncharacterized protein n=1 Tax=Natronobacterium lacisalsi AJ5 TaxID=358396 RepID=M0LM40_NATLA|nr:DUF892 family protein [Halobiforma lacisalsi]APW96927.1 hypothetical protein CHINAEXTREME_03695 [Halobiforma lacisalsi AJ5]EMA34637.1 hypothetical protein C445_06935 [Halobiforma lacisalsi AJ5]
MSTSTTPHDALATRLERLYYVERTLRSELETLSTDVAIDSLDDLRELECREQLQYAIDQHREETERHIGRIERAFDALGVEPDTRPVPELDGLLADKEKFNNVVLNDEVRPLYYVETTLKLEAIECTAYESALTVANAIDGDSDGDVDVDIDVEAIVDALGENYRDECEVRAEIEAIAESDAHEALLEASVISGGDPASLDRPR